LKPALVRRMLNNLVRSRMGALAASFLRTTGLAPLAVRILHSGKKETIELAYQVEWVREFQNNRSKVLEHWRRYREFDQALTLCDISDSSRILDVGCGISTVLHFLPGERHGVDPLADEYKKLYSYPTGISVQKAFGEELPFPDQYFDVVFCSNVLDHVVDPQRVVQEIRRVLQPDGCLVLTVWK
jgi:SAM-dependent methyltransferase